MLKVLYRAIRIEQEAVGIGLGLAQVKGLTESYGGQVGVRSRLGEGASFRFSLPELNLAAAQARQSAARFIAGENNENPVGR